MCGKKCSIATIVAGVILVVVSCVVGFVVVPEVIKSFILREVALIDDTIQMERFEEQPFPVNFTVRIFNLSNAAEVLTGAIPVMTEVGPYTYKLYQTRNLTGRDNDTVSYVRNEKFEFDPVASYPNTEDDLVTIINVPYHAIIQVAEQRFPNLLSLLNLAMGGVFGENNSPVATYRVRDLLFDGISLCQNAGLIGGIACGIIRDIAETTQNIAVQPDNSLIFSVLGYKEAFPSLEYRVSRGLDNPADLGRIITYNNSRYFNNWVDDAFGFRSVCNMINGTDAGIFPPFVDRDQKIYAINTDICRSVELRYQCDTEFEGIPAVRFAANEWLLDNDDGCFCLNVTPGITREDGCLLRGAIELNSCVGAPLVLSYPHFLFADPRYRNGVLGMRPDEDIHKIFMDLEPNTGTPLKGAKRAQFNIFQRPVTGIPPTQVLQTTLVPIMWVEEGVSLPEEYVEELANRLLGSLRIVDILIPVLIAICALVLLLGIIFTVIANKKKPANNVNNVNNNVNNVNDNVNNANNVNTGNNVDNGATANK